MKPVRCACDSGDNARTMPRPTVTTNLQAGHCESGMPVPQRGHRNRICAGLVAAAGCMRAPVADSGRKDRRFHGGADGIHDVHAWYRSRQPAQDTPAMTHPRSEEHTSELKSLMRISYAVFCLKKKK